MFNIVSIFGDGHEGNVKAITSVLGNKEGLVTQVIGNGKDLLSEGDLGVLSGKLGASTIIIIHAHGSPSTNEDGPRIHPAVHTISMLAPPQNKDTASFLQQLLSLRAGHPATRDASSPIQEMRKRQFKCSYISTFNFLNNRLNMLLIAIELEICE